VTQFDRVAAPAGSEAARGAPPLVVDLDGTLVATDTLWEGFLHLASHRPRSALRALLTLAKGRAAFKEFVAKHAWAATERLPLDERVVALIAERRAAGQPVVLVTGANIRVAEAVGARINADAVHGSDTSNLTGARKLARVREIAATFDYVGNASVDLPLWSASRQAIAVNAGAVTRWRARRARSDLVELPVRRAGWRAWQRALRPHQWAKNTLLFLPAIAGHLHWTWDFLITMLTGFVAFSATASAVYVVNDLCDVVDDRKHSTKHRRPFASGLLSIGDGVRLAAGLLGLAALLSLRLPVGFVVVMAIYLVLSTSYSLALKRKLALDVILLATLYTLRVVAGSELAGIRLTRWFLAFSVFFFLSLALAKRVIELIELPEHTDVAAPGRRYVRADAPVLMTLGAGATMASALVYCLYITTDEVTRLYHRAGALWLGLPLMLYWESRLWLMAARREVHEDPVVFALRDPTSRLALLAFALVLFIAL